MCSYERGADVCVRMIEELIYACPPRPVRVRNSLKTLRKRGERVETTQAHTRARARTHTYMHAGTQTHFRCTCAFSEEIPPWRRQTTR